MVLKQVLLVLASPVFGHSISSQYGAMAQVDDFEMYGDNGSRLKEVSLLEINDLSQEIDKSRGMLAQTEENNQNLILNQMLQNNLINSNNQISVKPITNNQQIQQEKCMLFTGQFKDAYDKIQNAYKHSQVLPEPTSFSSDDEMTNLPHLLLSSIEFCFSTQSTDLEMPYDLKISQCLVAMHNFMSAKIQQIQQLENDDNSSTDKPSSLKYDKLFCKELPPSLVQLSDYLYSDKENPKTKETDELVQFPWMPDYAEDINLNNLQIDLDMDNDDLDKEDTSSSSGMKKKGSAQASLLQQGITISLQSWIRHIVSQIKNDCSKRTGDINVSFFIQNCPQILQQQVYLPVASQSDINTICAKVERNFQKKEDKCITVSKEITEEYLRKQMKPIFTYVSNFATSDSFFTVIQNNFIDTNWDLTKFDVSNKKSKNYAEQNISFKGLAQEMKSSVVKHLVGKSVHSKEEGEDGDADEQSEGSSAENSETQHVDTKKHDLAQTSQKTSEKLIEQQQAYIELLEKQKQALDQEVEKQKNMMQIKSQNESFEPAHHRKLTRKPKKMHRIAKIKQQQTKTAKDSENDGKPSSSLSQSKALTTDRNLKIFKDNQA